MKGNSCSQEVRKWDTYLHSPEAGRRQQRSKSCDDSRRVPVVSTYSTVSCSWKKNVTCKIPCSFSCCCSHRRILFKLSIPDVQKDIVFYGLSTGIFVSENIVGYASVCKWHKISLYCSYLGRIFIDQFHHHVFSC